MDPPPVPPRYSLSQVFSATVSERQSHIQFRSFSQARKSLNYEDLALSSYIKPKEVGGSGGGGGGGDNEISIFDAQRYFGEGNNGEKRADLNSGGFAKFQQNQDASGARRSSVSSEGYRRNLRTRSSHATPTASSEASWNSQTGLLANPPGSMLVSMKNFPPDENKVSVRRNSSGKKSIFGRRCCCTGKESIGVKEAIRTAGSGRAEIKNVPPPPRSDFHKGVELDHQRAANVRRQMIPPASGRIPSSPENDFAAVDTPRQQRITASGRPFVDGTNGFLFPILKNPTHTVKTGPRSRPLEEEEEPPPRESLEVFQPAGINHSAIGGSKHHHFNSGSPLARVVSLLMTTDDDMGSDASSDLFELDTFSTQAAQYPMYRRRDSLDEAPSFKAQQRFASIVGGGQLDRKNIDELPTPAVAVTECYAPSEVSIDWSVTTAEGFDRASVSNFSFSASEAAGGADEGRRKGNSGGLQLLSCRQEKAVSVGPQPVKCMPAGEGRGSDSSRR